MTQAENVTRWQERLRRFDNSQNTVAQFCADEGISQPSYYHWRRKLRGPAMQKMPMSTEPAARFVPVALHTTPPTPEAPEAPQAITQSRRATATIELPGGIRIHVEVPAQWYRDNRFERPSGEDRS